MKSKQPFLNNPRLVGQKPDLVCIGAQKSGTSWFHSVLSERPDIWAPPFKEIHFFDTKFVEECRKWTGWHIYKSVTNARSHHIENNLVPNLDYLEYLDSILKPPMFNGTWYKHIFSRAPEHSIRLDVTPEYSCISEEGVDFVANFLRDTKFVYIVRAPLERVLSQLKMEIIRKGVPSTKNGWVELTSMPVLYSRGDYKTYIPRWRRRFDEERLLIVPFSQISECPLELLSRVEQFAGLKPFKGYTKAIHKIHSSKNVAIPDYVIEILRKNTMEQTEFLAEKYDCLV